MRRVLVLGSCPPALGCIQAQAELADVRHTSLATSAVILGLPTGRSTDPGVAS